MTSIDSTVNGSSPAGDSWLADALTALTREQDAGFLDFLPSHDVEVDIDSTRTTVRTHVVRTDVSGVPAIDSLSRLVASGVVDFCMPRSRIDEAQRDYEVTKSTGKLMLLQQEARDLFVKSTRSGEGGELLLFLLMERLLKLPQLLAKMPLKTNPQVHVHGSDGVHGRIGDDGVLELFWGESKLHASATSGLASAMASIAPYFDGSNSDVRARDLLLVRDHLNVDDKELTAKLIRYFDPYDTQSLDIVWSGACLVGFDHLKYPYAARPSVEEGLAEIAESIGDWKSKILDGVGKGNLLEVRLEVFCVPFPSIEDFRSNVLRNLGVIN